MRIPFLNFLRNGDGNALIETAIALPVLILIMSGVIDFGYMFAVSNNMQSVSNETGTPCRHQPDHAGLHAEPAQESYRNLQGA
jgi:Flp pilus assembly protein TadG